VRKHAASGRPAVEAETRATARWAVSHLKESMPFQKTGQTEEEDQVDQDQGCIDAMPVNHPANDRSHGRDEHALDRRTLMIGPGLTRSSIRESYWIQPALALPRQEMAPREDPCCQIRPESREQDAPDRIGQRITRQAQGKPEGSPSGTVDPKPTGSLPSTVASPASLSAGAAARRSAAVDVRSR
jgi:hypothetical protein